MNDNPNVAVDAGGTSIVTIIKDSTARWLVIVLLTFGVAYALIGERSNHEAALHAEMKADLAQYQADQQRIDMAKAGVPLTPLKKEKRK